MMKKAEWIAACIELLISHGLNQFAAIQLAEEYFKIMESSGRYITPEDIVE
jgi:hypothetical protein